MWIVWHITGSSSKPDWNALQSHEKSKEKENEKRWNWKINHHHKWISSHHNHRHRKCRGRLVCHMRFYVIYAILIVLFTQVQYGTISCHLKCNANIVTHTTHADHQTWYEFIQQNTVFGYGYFMRITCMSACRRPHSGKQVIHRTAQALIGTDKSIHISVYLAPGSNVADSFAAFYPFCDGVFICNFVYLFELDHTGSNRFMTFHSLYPLRMEGKWVRKILLFNKFLGKKDPHQKF